MSGFNNGFSPLRAAALVVLCSCIGAGSALASEPSSFTGPGGGDQKFDDAEIAFIDGDGSWVLSGHGQDLSISEGKRGNGTLTLRDFGSISIGRKSGAGALTIESSTAVTIKSVEGNGQVYLHLDGAKRIDRKSGNGNVYYFGSAPSIGAKTGNGQIIAE